MGIQGLLSLLAPITHSIHLRDLSGWTIGVDTYVWLHRGSLTCSPELCKNKPTHKLVKYCLDRIKQFQSYGINLMMVLDGNFLPMKLDKEKERDEKRKKHMEKALELEKNGNVREARKEFDIAVNISPSVTYELIKRLRIEGIPYIVAPYEADAQLAFLSMNNYVDAVLTEDSDLLVFGAKSVIVKLDIKTETCQIIHLEDIKNIESLSNFTNEMFQQLCILSGCDYLSNITGIRLKKALNIFNEYGNINDVIGEIEKKYTLPEDYRNEFTKSHNTFKHQLVYNPISKILVPLTPFDNETNKDLEYIGEYIDGEVAQKNCRRIL